MDRENIEGRKQYRSYEHDDWEDQPARLSNSELTLGKREQPKPGQCRLHKVLPPLQQKHVAGSECHVAESSDEPGPPSGQSQQVHTESRVQVESPGCVALGRAVRADDGLQRGDVFRTERLIDFRKDVPRPLKFEACSVDKSPDLPGVGLNDEDVVGVYDLIAGWRAVNYAATKKTCDHNVLLGQLLEVAHELPDESGIVGYTHLGHVAFDVQCFTQGDRGPPVRNETPAHQGDEQHADHSDR